MAQLNGSAGNDRIDVSAFTGPTTLSGGGKGDDTIIGGAGDDLLDEYLAYTDNLTLTDSQLIGSGTESFSAIDRFRLRGNEKANRIDASACTKSVTLLGNGGNDTLIGGSAGDLLDGGNGTDSITGGPGDDTILGAESVND